MYERDNMATKKTTTKKTEEALASKQVSEPEMIEVIEEVKKPLKAKQIDPNQYVTVYNGFQGKLVYISKRTGERWEWENFGDEQEMELSELKNARNSTKKFFANNWFLFEDQWIIDHLGLGQYYKNALPLEGFDEIFEKTPEEIESAISLLSSGQKRSVAYRAQQLIADGEIDSNKVIKSLEKSLGVDLVER